MKTFFPISLKSTHLRNHLPLPAFIIFGLLLWQFIPFFLKKTDHLVGLLDAGIWQMLAFSLITFSMLLVTSFFLFVMVIKALGLPGINTMVLQFNNLQIWHQFVIYWASFALVLLGNLMCLIAVF